MLKLNRNSFEGYEVHADVQRRIARVLFEEISGYNNIKSLVEIGCGTGFLSEHIVNHFKEANHFISDLSIEMAVRCHKKFSNVGVTCLACDGEMLPFKKVDLIVSNMALHWFKSFDLGIEKLFDITTYLAFSIPILGSFKAWDLAHEKLGIKNRMIKFYSLPELDRMISNLKPKSFSIKTISLSQKISSFIGLLHHLRAVSARAFGSYTVTELRALCREPVAFIDYEIAICIIEK